MPGAFFVLSAHMVSMRTITQHSEVLDLTPSSILVDDTDTPMNIVDRNWIGILAGPYAGQFRPISSPGVIALPATVRWEPVS